MLVSHLSLFSVFASLLFSAQAKDAQTNVAATPKQTILGAVTEPTDEQYALLKLDDSEKLKKAALKVGFELVEKDNVRFLIPDRYGSKSPYYQATALVSALQQTTVGTTLSMKDLPPEARSLLRQVISSDESLSPFRGTMLSAPNLTFHTRVAVRLTLKNGSKAVTLKIITRPKDKPGKSSDESPDNGPLRLDPDAEAKLKSSQPAKPQKPFSFAFYFSASLLEDIKRIELERQYLDICFEKVKALKANFDVAMMNASRNALANGSLCQPLSDLPVDYSQLPPELQSQVLSNLESIASQYGLGSAQECEDFLKGATVAVDRDSCDYGIQFQPVEVDGVAMSGGMTVRIMIKRLGSK